MRGREVDEQGMSRNQRGYSKQMWYGGLRRGEQGREGGAGMMVMRRDGHERCAGMDTPRRA